MAKDSIFIHRISGQEIHESVTQYVDDKTEHLNKAGAGITPQLPKTRRRELLFDAATHNTEIWTKMLWLSGGNINPDKCFYYYMKPFFNYTKHTIAYESSKKAPGSIQLTDPATNQETHIKRIEPTEARRTLGAIIAPNDNGTEQIKQTIQQAREYVGKIKHCKLSKKAKWTAITTVLQPKIAYPLMSCQCKKNDIDQIERILAKAECNTLRLNEHFPRAIYYGPYHLGGMAIPSINTETLTSRITYFLYHIRLNTRVGRKLEASYVYLQLEVGIFGNFLSRSYITYGGLTTKTMIKQIWSEMEPLGITLRCCTDQTWTPQPQGPADFSIMEYATGKYDTQEIILLNRYCLYLQVLSLYDIMLLNLSEIHPDIQKENVS